MTSAYASTAYDSTQPRSLPELPEVGIAAVPYGKTWAPRLPLQGVQCGEFLLENDADYIEIIAAIDDYSTFDVEEVALHEHRFWSTGLTAHNVLLIFTWFMGALSVTSVFVMVFLLISGDLYFVFIKGGGVFFFCYLIHRLGKYLLTTPRFKQEYQIRLSRKTGMIGKRIKGQWVDKPFDEFAPYDAKMGHYNLSTSHRLALVHRYSKKFRIINDYKYHPWEVQQEWEFWQQYMDVSLPLPDVPQFEPFRRHDPVTVAYDKKWGRPEDFWKSMDPKAYGMMFNAARRAAQTYPWGLSREQALAQGWQPSGFDQEAQRETWYQAVADGCRFAVQDKKLLLVPPEEYAREHNVGPGVLLG